MGNAPGKPHAHGRNKKYLHLKGSERPEPPGRPYLAAEQDASPDVLTIKWDPPLKTGGLPVTTYLIEHRRTGAPNWAKPQLSHNPELTLNGLEPGWRYQFRVFAENLVGLSDSSEVSEPLTVTMVARSGISAPKFTKELKDTVVVENEKVEFVVHYLGQPAPKLCWFKDGFEIFSSRRTRILTESDRSVLTIHQAAVCDEGEIKCTATNKTGHVSTKARLTLEAPPSIRLPRQYEDGLLFEMGEVIRLKVSVAGLPPPLIFWSHNGESINENERYEIENDDKTSTVRIGEALRTDRGEYQIKAVNKLGSDIASFLVTVTDKPSAPGRAKVLMSLGRSVTLSWNTPEDDGGCKIGNYIVEYYRLGWNVWLKAATSRQTTTVLGDLIEGSEYRFRVKAESPFGVSEPSEETELVFIPDPKRGIVEPMGGRRSPTRTQQDVPVAAKRRKPRSHSQSRGFEDDESTPGSPIRPERGIKSPPKTPDRCSPKPERKDISINKAIFDRAHTQDVFYGSPEFQIKKTDVPVPKGIEEVRGKPNQTLQDSIINTIPNEKSSISPERQRGSVSRTMSPDRTRSPAVSRTMSPERKTMSPERTTTKVETPISNTTSPVIGKTSNGALKTKSPPIIIKDFSTERSPSPAPVSDRWQKMSRDNSVNAGGSSEFMMVLYPGEHNRDMESPSEFGFALDSAIPPPLSLSAPELGVEPPQLFEAIRLSASSTELLHERALARFYQEAVAEEENLRKRRESSNVPKIQINSKDEGLVGLERNASLRRRLSSGGVTQNVLLAAKRHSLRGSSEFSDLFDAMGGNKLTVEEKRVLMQSRQRSRSEEREEEEFEKVRQKMTPVQPKKKISVVQEEDWGEDDVDDEEYIESIPSSSEEDEERFENVPRTPEPEEEDMTYHPRMMVLPEKKKSKYEEPFEILTKPAKLPDANFVPKPILKKRDGLNGASGTSESESTSPEVLEAKQEAMKRDAFVALKKQEPYDIKQDRKSSITEIPAFTEEATTKKDTSAIASVAGVAAAGIIISQPILHQKEAEEAKVVIEHYGDLVKSYRERSVKNLDNNPIREALRKAAQLQAALHQEPEEEEDPEPPPQPRIANLIIGEPKKPKLKVEQMPPRSATPIFMQSKVDNKNSDIFTRREEMLNRAKEDAVSAVAKQEERGREIKRAPQEKDPIAKSRSGSSVKKRSDSSTRKLSDSSTRGSDSSTKRRSDSTSKRSESSNRQRANSSARKRADSATKPQPRKRSTSTSTRTPSPATRLRPPKMCEIMTQTSTTTEPPPPLSIPDQVLKVRAQEAVRSTVDYMTDLAMFAISCWLFLFSNELFAVPFLLIAIFRQLKEEMKRWVPQWIKKRWNKKKPAE